VTLAKRAALIHQDAAVDLAAVPDVASQAKHVVAVSECRISHWFNPRISYRTVIFRLML
jgi:hypothetical protein